MTKEQFRREATYGAAMALTAEMAVRGLVLPEEYAKMNARFAQKTTPCIGRTSTYYDARNR